MGQHEQFLFDAIKSMVALRIAELINEDVKKSGVHGIKAMINDDLLSVTVRVEDTVTITVNLSAEVNR